MGQSSSFLTDNIIIILGHGAVGDKSQLIEFRDVLVTIRDKVSTLKCDAPHFRGTGGPRAKGKIKHGPRDR